MIKELMDDPLEDWRSMDRILGAINCLMEECKLNSLIAYDARDAIIFLQGAAFEIEDAKKRLRIISSGG